MIRTEDGNVELAEAVNIDISNRYKPRRRPGQVSTAISVPGHSFYDAGSFGLFVSGIDLVQLSSSFTTSTLRSGLTDAAMSYTEQADKIFYSNGYEKGYIKDGSDNGWYAPTDPYKAVDTSRSFSSPPPGQKLATFAGRIFIAQDNVLWFTEPFAPFLVDMARNAFMFDSRIREIIPVTDGIFVSTNTKTAFLSGTNIQEMVQQEVTRSPLIPGTVVQTDADEMPDLQQRRITGSIFVATTTEGICVFGSGSFFMNLTKHKIDVPTSSQGSAYIHNGKYVVNLQ